MDTLANTTRRRMTVDEFLAWEPGDGLRYQLINGEPRVMAPTLTIHARVQMELAWLLMTYFRTNGMSHEVLPTPGVIPAIFTHRNFRIPDICVINGPAGDRERSVADPIVIVEVLSPSNEDDTWANVWAYTSMPSVREILIVRTDRIEIDLLRRDETGQWPSDPEIVRSGCLSLVSIGFRVDVKAVYARTELLA